MNDKGVKYENIARKFLQNKGFEILTQNFFCSRGEIDIIAWKDHWLCFTEVRYRAQNLESAIQSVDKKKAEKIKLAAQNFLWQNPWFENSNLRFDLVAISKDKKSGKYFIQHLKNFF